MRSGSFDKRCTRTPGRRCGWRAPEVTSTWQSIATVAVSSESGNGPRSISSYRLRPFEFLCAPTRRLIPSSFQIPIYTQLRELARHMHFTRYSIRGMFTRIELCKMAVTEVPHRSSARRGYSPEQVQSIFQKRIRAIICTSRHLPCWPQ